jgi:hypothetical protein
MRTRRELFSFGLLALLPVRVVAQEASQGPSFDAVVPHGAGIGGGSFSEDRIKPDDTGAFENNNVEVMQEIPPNNNPPRTSTTNVGSAP